VNEVGTGYTVYANGRGSERFNSFWRLDLSGRYQYAFRKDFSGYLKVNVLNVTDNDELTSFNTSGTVSLPDANGNFFFIPGANFGRARSELDYQLPRTFTVTAGLEW
jgi:hypothetical protein